MLWLVQMKRFEILLKVRLFFSTNVYFKQKINSNFKFSQKSKKSWTKLKYGVNVYR